MQEFIFKDVMLIYDDVSLAGRAFIVIDGDGVGVFLLKINIGVVPHPNIYYRSFLICSIRFYIKHYVIPFRGK